MPDQVIKQCELCGCEYKLLYGRGYANRVSCYKCTDSPKDRKDNYRNKHLKKKYGITLYQLKKMFEEQHGKCVVCSASMTFNTNALRKGEKRGDSDMCVDHCHSTGNVRGLLCFHCNTALGHVFDDENILANMIQYLKETKW